MDFPTESKTNTASSLLPDWASHVAGDISSGFADLGHFYSDHKVATLGTVAGVAILAGMGAVVAMERNPEAFTSLVGRVYDGLGTSTSVPFRTSNFWEYAAKEGFSGIETAHPDRFLIRMPGYGYDATAAAKAENLIAATRDAIKSGEINSAAQLDHYVAPKYYQSFLRHQFRFQSMDRIAETGEADRFDLALKGKHEPYNQRLFARFKSTGKPFTLNANLGGEEVPVTAVRLQKNMRYGADRFLNGSSETSARPALAMSTDKVVLGKMSDRLETLFQEITGKAEAAPETAANPPDMQKFGEFEWLSAHQYKERKAVAGITQIKIRALLEAMGYDSGRFKVRVDPNLEALTSDMEPFTRKYADLFAIKPHLKPVQSFAA
jgi:hypothetical protein